MLEVNSSPFMEDMELPRADAIVVDNGNSMNDKVRASAQVWHMFVHHYFDAHSSLLFLLWYDVH
jgi:hypothetical protein